MLRAKKKAEIFPLSADGTSDKFPEIWGKMTSVRVGWHPLLKRMKHRAAVRTLVFKVMLSPPSGLFKSLYYFERSVSIVCDDPKKHYFTLQGT